jgi:hypothetical protein
MRKLGLIGLAVAAAVVLAMQLSTLLVAAGPIAGIQGAGSPVAAGGGGGIHDN